MGGTLIVGVIIASLTLPVAQRMLLERESRASAAPIGRYRAGLVHLKEGHHVHKRDRLEALLEKITDDEFNSIWHDAYGCFPNGGRTELAKDFVAEQYDEELDGSIALAESFLTHAPRPRPKCRGNHPR
jgi:hypothetical protein